MRRFNPDFEVKLFADDEAEAFVESQYPEFMAAWLALRTPVEKADLFRVLAVHHFGGFYFDLDVLMCRPLEPLLEYSCIFPFEQMADPYTAASVGVHEQLGQYAFGARPGHPLLLRYAENIRQVALQPELGPPPDALDRHPAPNEVVRIVLSTGPGMLARTLGQEPALGRDLHVLSAVPDGSPKRLLYCFGPFGSHAMMGVFGWKDGRRSIDFRTAARLVAWVKLLRYAYRRAAVVGRASPQLELWRKPARWAALR